MQRNAIIEEIKSIEKNHTWELVNVSERNKTIDVKWIFKLKVNPDGTASKYNAKLVAKGFLHIYGIEYNELFAHMKRLEIIRLVVPITNNGNWSPYHLDVKSSFLMVY